MGKLRQRLWNLRSQAKAWGRGADEKVKGEGKEKFRLFFP